MANFEMNLGNYKSTSWNKDVNGDKKKMIPVNGAELASQSESRSRGGRMDLNGGTVNPIQPSTRDTYQ